MFPEYLTDGFVIQRGKPLRVPGADGIEYKAFRGAELPPMCADPEPGTLILRLDDHFFEFNDVVVGDVWLAGGQSNMEWELQNAVGGAEELSSVNLPLVRFLNVPKTGNPGFAAQKPAWKRCENGENRDMSGVAYWAAKTIHNQTGIPLGIVDCYKGGTSALRWISRGYLDRFPAGKGAENPEYEGMLTRVKGLPLRGFWYYQGETDADDNAGDYFEIMLHLAAQWRSDFGADDLPFVTVQLPDWDDRGPGWDIIRKQQARISSFISNGMLVRTRDIVKDTNDLHPKDKRVVGERLGNMVKERFYHGEV